MHVRILQQDLYTLIQTVQRAIATHSIVPLLAGIMLESKNDSLTLAATDTQIRIQCAAPANVEAEGSVVLPGKYLSELVRRIPETEVTVSVDSNFVTTLTWGKAEYSIHGLDAEGFPKMEPSEHAVRLGMSQGTLRSLIKKSSFASARDDTRPILQGVLLRVLHDTLEMVSTDGVRLSKVEINLEEPKSDIDTVIPGRTLAEISRICSGKEEEPVFLYVGQKEIMLEASGVKLVSSLMQGSFPEYQAVIPDEFVASLHVNVDSFHDALDRACLISQSSMNAVRILAQGGHISIRASAPEIGQVIEEVEGFAEGEDIDIPFNARLITDGLKVLETEEVTLEVPGPRKASLIRENEAFVYLVLPLDTR